MTNTIYNELLSTTSLRLAMGLEIELKGLRDHNMSETLRNHSEYYFLAPKVTHEYIDGGGCELRLPPLEIGSPYTNNFLKKFYSYLDSTLNQSVNKSCGHHVHIGLRPITESQESFFNNSIERFKLDRNFYYQSTNEMLNLEVTKDFIYKYTKNQALLSSMLPKSRRDNRMCKPINIDCLDSIKNATTIEQLMKAISTINDRSNNYYNKFYSVNLHKTYLPKNTVEIRQHSGTLSFDKINRWTHLMLGMINHSYKHRVKLVNHGESESFVMSNIFRPRTKLYKFYELASRPNGATTRELMQECNINDARSIRRTVNTIKARYRTQKAVICNTQHSYGHANGESNQQYDLNGYKINDGQTLTRMSNGNISIDYSVTDSVFADTSNDLETYFLNRIETLR